MSLELSYRASKAARKSLFEDVEKAIPDDCKEATRWEELKAEFGLTYEPVGFAAAVALLEVISAEQNEEIQELNDKGATIVIPVDARKDN